MAEAKAKAKTAKAAQLAARPARKTSTGGGKATAATANKKAGGRTAARTATRRANKK